VGQLSIQFLPHRFVLNVANRLGSDTRRTDRQTLPPHKVFLFLLFSEHLINDKHASLERTRSWDPSKYTAFKHYNTLQYNTVQYSTIDSVLITDLSHAYESPHSAFPENKL
jgi:hypothetical protein